MNNNQTENPVITRTSRGPTVAGSRLTIYAIMDELRAGRSPDFVQGWYRLTDEEMAAVLRYLSENAAELEREYTAVLRRAEEGRRYWTARNKQLLQQLDRPPADYKISHARAALADLTQDDEPQHEQPVGEK